MTLPTGRWYTNINRETSQSLYLEEQIVELIRQGELRGQDFVWESGTPKVWRRVDEIPGFAAHLVFAAQPAPAPPAVDIPAPADHGEPAAEADPALVVDPTPAEAPAEEAVFGPFETGIVKPTYNEGTGWGFVRIDGKPDLYFKIKGGPFSRLRAGLAW